MWASEINDVQNTLAVCGCFVAILIEEWFDPSVLRWITLSVLMSCSICWDFCLLRWLKGINKLLLGAMECCATPLYSQIKEETLVWQRIRES